MWVVQEKSLEFGVRRNRIRLPGLNQHGIKIYYGREAGSMFESLDDRMKHDDQEVTTTRERLLKWVVVGVISVIVFGGLWMGVRMME